MKNAVAEKPAIAPKGKTTTDLVRSGKQRGKHVLDDYYAAKEERRLARERDDQAAVDKCGNEMRETADRFNLTVSHIWERILAGALDFQMAREFGDGSTDGQLDNGTEQLWMNAAGDCIIRTSENSQVVTLRESAQWMQDMFRREITNGTWSDEIMTEWFGRVAKAIRD
jgi:hypothetical protein